MNQLNHKHDIKSDSFGYHVMGSYCIKDFVHEWVQIKTHQEIE